MDGAAQTQYYSFLERTHRQAIQCRALINQYNYQIIKHFILNGGNPAEDPDISSDFWKLIDEFGEKLFADELAKNNLVFENDTVKPLHSSYNL